MTRRIRALNKGRARIWWVHHRRDAIRALQFTTLAVLWLVQSAYQHRDDLAMAQAATAEAEQLAEDRRGLATTLPPVTFVFQATTHEELRERLADVAGAADLELLRLKPPKK